MKLRHITLFLLASATLITADLPGSSLLAFCLWLQINSLFKYNLISKSSQLWALKLFLITVPFLLFWGSTHSFLFIYATEQNWIFFLMALVLNFCLCLIASICYLFTFEVALKTNFQVIESLNQAWILIKEKKLDFFKYSGILFLFTLIPRLEADWKIVFAIMATHLFLNRHQLKQVFAAGF